MNFVCGDNEIRTHDVLNIQIDPKSILFDHSSISPIYSY